MQRAFGQTVIAFVGRNGRRTLHLDLSRAVYSLSYGGWTTEAAGTACTIDTTLSKGWCFLAISVRWSSADVTVALVKAYIDKRVLWSIDEFVEQPMSCNCSG